MSDRIRAVLEQRIIDGTLPPGSRLLELEIAKEFNTSQTPVREALESLHSLRLVESERYRGTYVRAITDREMDEAYSVRGALEQLAAELAAPKLKGNVSELREILQNLHSAAADGDTHGYALHNDEFHRAIVDASDNTLLIEAWQSLGFEARVRIHLSRRHEPHLVARAAEHDPAVDALEQGDGATAGRFLREHAELCRLRWKQRHLEGRETAIPHGDALPVPATVLS
ncbi:GntR family transcriptional regulator [Planctomicrobium piriforme]|nr:GntR family transcriptional regulator [Planctomicrobium piriforme]